MQYMDWSRLQGVFGAHSFIPGSEILQAEWLAAYEARMKAVRFVLRANSGAELHFVRSRVIMEVAPDLAFFPW